MVYMSDYALLGSQAIDLRSTSRCQGRYLGLWRTLAPLDRLFTMIRSTRPIDVVDHSHMFGVPSDGREKTLTRPAGALSQIDILTPAKRVQVPLGVELDTRDRGGKEGQKRGESERSDHFRDGKKDERL